MSGSSSSALITDHGQHVLLRIHGVQYDLSQDELRSVLGLPPGPSGLGITVDGTRFCFEFVNDDRTVELSAEQLHRRLANQLAHKT